VMQVVSADSQAENASGASVAPFGNVASLQKPKKWVRWSDHEDQILTRAVDRWGENNFRHISEQIFHGSRTEVQCKNRWKKVIFRISSQCSSLLLSCNIIILVCFLFLTLFRLFNLDW
jgi:hypothetical protein